MPTPALTPRLLTSLTILSIPIFLTTYLHHFPLSASKTRTIHTNTCISPSCSASHSVRQIINPRDHVAGTDSRSIFLSAREIGNASDEEVLARFLRGFWGGWVFAPEMGMIRVLGWMGRYLVRVGFEGVETEGAMIAEPSELSRTKIPPRYTPLFGENFMVLDVGLRSERIPEMESREENDQSFVEVGFGDNRKGFAGLHRFELVRDDGVEGQGVTICYSCISCNPTVDKLPFPRFIFNFHEFYAMCLFRDGIAGVLKM